MTLGKPRVVSVEPAGGQDPSELLRLAASWSAGASILSAAVVAGAQERGVPLEPVTQFESVTGRGVMGVVGGRKVAVGNRKLLEELAVDPGGLLQRAEALRGQGQTVMFVAVDGGMAGLLGVADPIKDTTPEALKLLHAENIRVVMVTGDSRTTAEAVARQLGITDVEAEVRGHDLQFGLGDRQRVAVAAGDALTVCAL